MLVPHLLLETLEDLSKDDFDKFKWYLGFNILKNCGQIPLSHLESPHRHNTVSKMTESYGEEMAVNVTVAILKKMNHNSAAERLKKTYTEGAAAQEKVSRAVGISSSSALDRPTERRSFTDGATGAIPPIASNGSMIFIDDTTGDITDSYSGNLIISGNVGGNVVCNVRTNIVCNVRSNVVCNVGGNVANNNVVVTAPTVYHHHHHN